MAPHYILYSTEIICNIKLLFKKNKVIYIIVVKYSAIVVCYIYLPRYFLFKKNTITQRLHYVSKTWIRDIIISEIFTGMKAWYSKIPLIYHWTFKTYNLEKQDIGKCLVWILLHLLKLHSALFFVSKFWFIQSHTPKKISVSQQKEKIPHID